MVGISLIISTLHWISPTKKTLHWINWISIHGWMPMLMNFPTQKKNIGQRRQLTRARDGKLAIARYRARCDRVDHRILTGQSFNGRSPQCEAPKVAKLVNITPITMLYGTQITSYNYSYWGLSTNRHHWGGATLQDPKMEVGKRTGPYVWPYELWGYSLKFRPSTRPRIYGTYLQ